MDGTATLTPTSTAPPTAQGQPDSVAEVKVHEQPKTIADKAHKALEEFRNQKSKEVQPKKTEDAPAGEPKEVAEGVTKPEEVAEQKPEEGKDQLPVLADSLEEISFNGKTVPLTDALADAEFEVFAMDKMHPVEGLEKLMDFASMGIAAAEKNRTAKEALVKAQEVIREVEAGVETKVNARLEELLRNALNGVNANGKPFPNAQAQQRAVELATEMKNQLGQGNQVQKAFTMEDVQKLVQEQVEKRLEEQSRKSTEEATRNGLVQQSRQALMDLTKTDATYFVKTDGKLNTTLLNSYRTSLMTETAQAWEQAGSPTDISAIKDIIVKTRAKLLPDYQISNPNPKPKETARPVMKPTSGAGVMPQNVGAKKKFDNIHDLTQETKRLLGLNKK